MANTPDAGGYPLNSGLGGRPCPATGNCTVPILNVAKDNVSGSVTYSREIVPNYKLTARFDDTFVGPSTDVAYYFGYDLPSYNIANLHLILEHEKWSANLFCENLTNEVALISGQQHQLSVQHPADRAVLDQPAANLRTAAQRQILISCRFSLHRARPGTRAVPGRRR